MRLNIRLVIQRLPFATSSHNLKLIKIRFVVGIAKPKALDLIEVLPAILNSLQSRIKLSAINLSTLRNSVSPLCIQRLLPPPTISSESIIQMLCL
jgi:hypothetical protein